MIIPYYQRRQQKLCNELNLDPRVIYSEQTNDSFLVESISKQVVHIL
jgi:hypothetical protein